MKKVFLIILSWAMLLASGTVNAQKISNLYEGNIPVKNQSPEERSIATQKALLEVFVKVSGNNQITRNPKIRGRMLAANNLVQEYGYEYPKIQDADNKYLLHLRFDKNGVNQWLRDASASIWGQNRPQVFAWIVTQKPDMIQIIQNDQNPLQVILEENAKRRGIPLILPQKNPQDILPTDIMSMSVDKLVHASRRNSAVLIGYIQQNSDNSQTAQWKLISGKDSWDFDFAGANEQEVLTKAIDQTANTLAGRYGIVTTNTIQKNIALRVLGISEHNDFAKLIRYLSRLTPVASVGISKISGNEILLSVNLRSTAASFTQAIALGQKLLPVAINFNAEPLIYQWNPS